MAGMKLRTSLAVLLLVSTLGCRRASGPLGIHVGDILQPGDSGMTVTAVGPDWAEFNGRRYAASELSSVQVECPHK